MLISFYGRKTLPSFTTAYIKRTLKSASNKSNTISSFSALPRISANSVAGLIGEHTFQTPEEALYDYFKRKKDTEELVRSMEQQLQRRSKHYVRQKILQENQDLQLLLESYESALDKAKDVDEASELYTVTTQEVMNILTKQGYITSYDTGRFISHSALQMVHQQRGSRLETQSIQQYEQTTQSTIKQRNTQQLKKSYDPYFLLTGRIDGYNEQTQTILEIKTRATGGKNINPVTGKETLYRRSTSESVLDNPNTFPHDIIQVRCYMEMKNAQFAEISEHYQGMNQPIITRIQRNEQEWNRIYLKLLQTIENMQKFFHNEEYRAMIVTASTIDIRDITSLQYQRKKSIRSGSLKPINYVVTNNTKKTKNEGISSTNTINPATKSISNVQSTPIINVHDNSPNSPNNNESLLMYNHIPGLPPL